MTRPTVNARVLLATLLASTLLVAVPASAAFGAGGDTSPQVRSRADGGFTYRDPALTARATTQVEGVLRRVVADSVDGSTESAVIVTDDNVMVPVEFDKPIAATDVAVTAQLVDGAKLDAALDGRPTSAVDVASAVVAGEVAAASGIAHRAYVAIVKNTGPIASTATINRRVDDGLAYWRSEGGSSIPSFKRVGSTVTFNSALSVPGNAGQTRELRCGLSDESLWNEAARKFKNVNFNASGNHLVVVVSGDCDDFGAGLGTVGSSVLSGGAITVTQRASIFTSTVGHEIGHNLGLEHANFCGPSCGAADEYWNVYSVMGIAISSSPAFEPTALDSVYRSQLGMASPGEKVAVNAGQSVTTDISPRGASSGIRGIQVRVGAASYWVDYRNGSGRDRDSFYAVADGGVINGRSYPDGVTVTRRVDAPREPTDLMTPSTTVGSFGVGQTFAAGDVTITVISQGSTAKVKASRGTVPPSLSAATPTYDGAAQVANTVTAMPGTWTPGTAFAYQWTANGVNISGATAQSLKVPASVVGKRLAVRVTGTNAGYSTEIKSSAGIIVAPARFAAPKPKISGTVKVGKILTAKPGTYAVPVKLSYRWYISGKAVSKSSTSARFKIPKNLKGKKILVKVTATKLGYKTVTTASAYTKKVAK